MGLIFLIDTVKIFTQINKNTYDIIKYKSKIKTCFNVSEEKIYYEIINDKLKGSYDSSLSVRVDERSFVQFIKLCSCYRTVLIIKLCVARMRTMGFVI